jgi:hypothetical protein
VPEKPQRVQHVKCPQCGETVLPEDKFCFHCGRRLKAHVAERDEEGAGRHIAEWPLAILGAIVIVGAAYTIHRQTHLLGQLRSQPRQHVLPNHRGVAQQRLHPTGPLVLHPVVTTTTTYPRNIPSSASWTLVAETYHNVQITLRLPNSMTTPLSVARTAWVWGAARTPYRVSVAVVATRPPTATQVLGNGVYGTVIQRTSATAMQSLFIRWAGHAWLDVSMTVPGAHANWLASIAESVRIS